MKNETSGNLACFGKEYGRQLRADSDSSKDLREFIQKRFEGGHHVPPQYQHYLKEPHNQRVAQATNTFTTTKKEPYEPVQRNAD